MKTQTINQLKNKSALPRRTFEKVAEKLFGVSPHDILISKDEIYLTDKQVRKFINIEAKIRKGVPLDYLIKGVYFYGREFTVDKNVLIPRPETELLVEQAIKYIVSSIKYLGRNPKIIDIGTGSGCIIISLFKELNTKYSIQNTKFFATDVSPAALLVAKKNARKYKTEVKFYRSDLFSDVRLPKKFDLILANLPYLKSGYSKENRDLLHEPKIALDGGRNGLEIIKRLIDKLPEKLNIGGAAILEVDPRQKRKLENHLKGQSLLKHRFENDLDKLCRFIILEPSSKPRSA